jgi:hypothetical protein
MSAKTFSLEAIRVVRSLRNGIAKTKICRAYQIDAESLEALEHSYRSVPDRELASMERTLGDNEKLRRLVAGLIQRFEMQT